MKINGEVGGKTLSFEELLQSISNSKSRSRILKTIVSSEHYTNGSMLTRLTQKELELVNSKHMDAIVSDSEYKAAAPFDVLEKAIPKYLRVECKIASIPRKVKASSKEEKLRVVVLESGPIRVYVEESPFLSFYKRLEQLLSGCSVEYNTSWWLSKKEYPIVVLDNRGFSSGKLLGTIAQISFDRKDQFDYGDPKMKRSYKKGIGWIYKPIGEENAS